METQDQLNLPLLSAEELRVLGSLIEKSRTTPDYYPMTLNGLTAACNQKTSRNLVVVSTFVDFNRLSIYATRFTKSGLSENLPLVICAKLAGIAEAYWGNKLLKIVTLRFVQVSIAVMLIIISLALGAGII